MSARQSAEKDAAARCPGCGHSCCPNKRGHAALECGGDSDAVRACAEQDAATRRRRLLRSWRKLWCCNGDAIWGHLCRDDEGCQR